MYIFLNSYSEGTKLMDVKAGRHALNLERRLHTRSRVYTRFYTLLLALVRVHATNVHSVAESTLQYFIAYLSSYETGNL